MPLSGDQNVPAMPMTDAEVNHLRRLLAWMRCEYTIDPHALKGIMVGASKLVSHGFITEQQGRELIEQETLRTSQCPVYIRKAVTVLTKALRHHDTQHGIVEQGEAKP